MDSDNSVLTAPPANHSEATAPSAHEAEPATGGHGAGAHGGAVHLPPTSLWPISLAFSITIGASALVLNWMVAVPALILFVLALRGWTQELLDAQH